MITTETARKGRRNAHLLLLFAEITLESKAFHLREEEGLE
jgi:hypothetical protein